MGQKPGPQVWTYGIESEQSARQRASSPNLHKGAQRLCIVPTFLAPKPLHSTCGPA
jgi:hypothetical protein